MLRISRLSDYSFILLVYIARHRDRSMPATELAALSALPLPTVAKILKMLTRSGLLVSRRGMAGGYMLGRLPEDVTVVEVLTAVEGPLALTACVEDAPDPCDSAATCPLRGRWDQVNTAVNRALESVTLADLVRNMAADDGRETAFLPPLAGGGASVMEGDVR